MYLGKSIFFFLLLLVLSACPKDSTVIVTNQPFFDLKSYFEQEQGRLKNELRKVIKKASVDGKLEEKRVDSIDVEKELALFVDSDINKIAWLDKYIVDSVFVDEVLNQVSYTTKDETLKTKQLIINYKEDQVYSIEIFRKTTSLIANFEQQLKYIPSEGYSIKSKQETSLSALHVLELDVQFLY